MRALKGDQIFDKCVPMHGDVGLPELGLSDKDRQTLKEEVEFVIHSAATVRFDDPLKKAVLLNVRGPKLMLELAMDMKKLEVNARENF